MHLDRKEAWERLKSESPETAGDLARMHMEFKARAEEIRINGEVIYKTKILQEKIYHGIKGR